MLNIAPIYFKEPELNSILLQAISPYRENIAVYSPEKGSPPISILRVTPRTYRNLLIWKSSTLPIYQPSLQLNKLSYLVSRRTVGTFRLYAETVLYALVAVLRMR